MGGITEGIGVGSLGALAWLVSLLVVAAPWTRERVPEWLLDGATAAVFVGVTVPLWQHASGLADRHGPAVGYGSVFGAAAVTVVVLALIVRRASTRWNWDLHDVPVGRVLAPAPKSRRG